MVTALSASSNVGASTSTAGLHEARVGVDKGEDPLSISSPVVASAEVSTIAQHLPATPSGANDLASSADSQVVEPTQDQQDTPSRRLLTIHPQPAQDASVQARSVRRNIILAAWGGFSILTKARRWILTLRLLVGLAQLILGIVILSLPTSLGTSFSTPNTCDPEGLFVFLTLHTIRVFFSIPIDFYLGLSPHRTPSARRIGSEGQSERERNRMIGSLTLDRKMNRFSDLLGLCQVVLFIVGNYIVWTSLECSHSPAESRPLWIACVSVLSISYLVIAEVMLMIFLLFFCLPLCITVLRALGLANHLPQREIHPETGKIGQSTIDEESRLVYFTLAKEVSDGSLPRTDADRSSRDDLERLDVDPEQDGINVDQYMEAAAIRPLPPSRGPSRAPSIQSKAPSHSSLTSRTPTPRRKRLGLLFGFSKKAKEDGREERGSVKPVEQGAKEALELEYPLYPIPAHRATCPICLCDFEEVVQHSTSSINEADGSRACPETTQVEPLRLLKCGHVMHKSCVDKWMLEISGRCPVCQAAVKPSATAHDGSEL